MKLEFNFDQSGIIPFRKINGKIEVLLITSLKKKRWIIPKGYIEFNLSAFESAKKEAFEEAGVLGSNETFELGSYTNNKASGVCKVKVYSMEVLQILNEYPEKNIRQRQWFAIEEAVQNITILPLKDMIKSLYTYIKV